MSGYTWVQSATPVASSGVTGTISYVSANTVGNLLVLVAATPSGVTPNSVTVNGSSVTNNIVFASATGGGSPAYCGSYCAICGSTATTWTVNWSGGGGWVLLAYEWSGNAASSEFDQATTWNPSSIVGTSGTTAALSPGAANELGIAVLLTLNTDSTSIAFGGGYTLRNNVAQGANFQAFVGDQVLSGSPSTTATATWTNGDQWGMAQALFSPSASGGATIAWIT